MVTPPAGDLQIAGRKSLQSKTQALNQLARSGIPGLNVCFQSMQAERSKSVGNHRPNSFRHVTVALMRRKTVIAEITGAKTAPHNLADIDNTRQFTHFGQNPIADVSRRIESLEILIELLRRLRRRHPTAMQFAASGDC